MEKKTLSVSRRGFIKGGVLAAAAAAAGGMMTGCEPQTTSKSEASAESAVPAEAQPIPPVDHPAEWTYETEVVVVGSGAGGLACADYLAQNGVKVILVEKQATTGGASRYSGGVANIYGGAATQNKYGIAWPEYPSNWNAFIAKYEEAHQWSVDQKLVKSMAFAGGPAIDWTLEHEGLEWMASPSGYCDMDMILGKQTGLMGMNNTIEAYDKSFLANGGEELLNTKASALVMDGDVCVGIQVYEQGSEVPSYIHATKGVALCAGGIGMNRDLIKVYMPSAYEGTAQGGPMPGNEGDAFRMGLGAGADVAGFDSWSCWEAAIDEETNGGDGEFWHYFWHGERQVFHNAFLIVNKHGERVPYYSNGVSGFNFEPSIQMGDMQNCAAWMSQPGGRVYSICDSNFEQNIKKHVPSNFFVDSSRIPIEPEMPILNDSLCSNDWRVDFEAAVERGAVKKADTLEELAVMLTLKPEVLKAAVENWNRICEAGIDDELVPPYDPSWLDAIKTPPYYGAILGGQMAKSGVGLRVNEKLQVVRNDKTPIEGLYANFWTAGGIIGEASYGGFWNGALHGGVGTSLVSGFRVAQSILGEDNEDPAINQRANFPNPEPFPDLSATATL